ncbi:hypothetical protein Z946_1725 [Sulfitobacter noctilucicola]|uniref:Uncharacterized protein n=1 Tax=Sulfitobacter noctilucicola TaxID=1342301 RepID=A0A7W6M6K0_9RHOB|nr:lipase chaperone [Sulfitobacter noctilucicola]KIN62862.1 hypothetical protein Z946_1725 [Sulfitobacter noctilucicola]MBB4172607.1 hypothetical protein [Sulfitobacter noctilucicola]
MAGKLLVAATAVVVAAVSAEVDLVGSGFASDDVEVSGVVVLGSVAFAASVGFAASFLVGCVLGTPDVPLVLDAAFELAAALLEAVLFFGAGLLDASLDVDLEAVDAPLFAEVALLAAEGVLLFVVEAFGAAPVFSGDVSLDSGVLDLLSDAGFFAFATCIPF